MTRLGRYVAVCALVLCAVSACGGSDGPSSKAGSLADLAKATLGSGPGVASVDAHQNPVGVPDEDRLNADKWSLGVEVVMQPTATTDEVARAATATSAFSKKYVGTARWTARVSIRGTASADESGPSGNPVQFEVYPETLSSPADDARAIMAARELPGVSSVAIAAKLPSVNVAQADDLTATFDKLRSMALWETGGSLFAENGRVRLADVPDRVTRDVMVAIIEAAKAHPSGEFWLEAPAVGPRWPELYVNRVTAEESATIEASFRNPKLATPEIPGFVPDFNIRAADVDTHGTFGDAE